MELQLNDNIIKYVLCTYLDNYNDITNTLSLLSDKNTHDIRYSLINSSLPLDYETEDYVLYIKQIKFPLEFKLDELIFDNEVKNSFADLILDYNLQYLKDIKKLVLPTNNKITDEGLKHLNNINILNLRDNDKITENGLKSIVGCKKFYNNGCGFNGEEVICIDGLVVLPYKKKPRSGHYGSLLDLVAYGPQDYYLSGNPEITYHTISYSQFD